MTYGSVSDTDVRGSIPLTLIKFIFSLHEQRFASRVAPRTVTDEVCHRMSANTCTAINSHLQASDLPSASRSFRVSPFLILASHTLLFVPHFFKITVELRLSGLISKVSHPDNQTIRIIGFFFANRLHWQSEVRLLLFTVCTRV